MIVPQGGAAVAEPVEHAHPPRAPAKKTFLKRGQGVARFGVNGKPPPERTSQPKKKKSASASKVSSKTSSSQSKGATGSAMEPKSKSSVKQVKGFSYVHFSIMTRFSVWLHQRQAFIAV